MPAATDARGVVTLRVLRECSRQGSRCRRSRSGTRTGPARGGQGPSHELIIVWLAKLPVRELISRKHRRQKSSAPASEGSRQEPSRVGL